MNLPLSWEMYVSVSSIAFCMFTRGYNQHLPWGIIPSESYDGRMGLASEFSWQKTQRETAGSRMGLWMGNEGYIFI